MSDVDPCRVYPDGLADEIENWQAVNWQIEVRGGDETKVPKRPDNPSRNAKSNDASTWGTFTDAIENATERDDVGFGFPAAQPGHPFVFIDIDIPEGGDWVPTYDILGGAIVERSPSNHRRVILTGDLEVPSWWTNQSEKTEDDETREAKLFTDSGYVALTGDVLEGHGAPLRETHQPAFEEWLRRAWRAFNPDEEAGPWEDDDSDTGEADDVDAPSDEWLDKETAEAALDHIDPDAPYDAWRDVGMALVNHFGSTTGGSLFKSWSRSGSKWDSDAERQADRIVKDAGSYGFDAGTLVYHAKRGGWDASTAAREAMSTRSDGGVAASSADDSNTTGPSTPNPGRDWTLSPANVINLAVDDPFHPLERDEDGKLKGGVQSINSSQKANYTWDLAKKTDNDNVLAQFKGPVYAYDAGVWRDDDNNRLRNIAYRALGDSAYSKRVVQELEDRVRKDRTKMPDELGAPDETILTESGLLDLRDRDVNPVKPEHYALAKIPTEYDPDAECPTWEEFLEDSVESEAERKKLQEYAGYTLWHHQQQFGKALFFVGPTDSGKGTTLKAIKKVIGSDNTSSESLHDLIQTRWGTAQLFGNIANIRNEVTPSGLKNIQVFKELTGGEDEISAEFKGQQKFKFVVTQKFLFSTNEIPTVEHADEAFYNRLLFVEFPNTVPPEDQDKQLLDKLGDERSGILNWMLDGLNRLLEQGQFTGERSINGKKEMCDAFGGVLDRFTHNCLMVTGDADDCIKKADLHELAQAYAEDIDKEPEWDTQTAFSRQMGNQRGISQGQKHIDGKNNKVFKGVRVKPETVFRYGMEDDLTAVTGDDGDAVNSGLGGFGDEIRAGYDSRDSTERDDLEADDRDVQEEVDDVDDDDDSLQGEPLGPHIVMYVRENQKGREGVPRDELVDELLDRGAGEAQIDHWIDKCLEQGDINEPASDVFRS